jgi:hypothetical protein
MDFVMDDGSKVTVSKSYHSSTAVVASEENITNDKKHGVQYERTEDDIQT